MIFILIYIYSYVYLCIYTPSYHQYFRAFPVSDINSETSFLYQLFNENSNYIVFKPCKVIYLQTNLTRQLSTDVFHSWSIHCAQRAQAKTLPSVCTSSQFYIPSGQFPVSNCNSNGHVALHAYVNSVTPDLRQCSSTHINYNIVRNLKAP